jgi:tRNA-dihydrouridine synthase
MCRAHLEANVAARGEHFGVRVTRRHLAGYLKGLPGAASLRRTLLFEDSLAGCLDILAEAEGSWSRRISSSERPSNLPTAISQGT